MSTEAAAEVWRDKKRYLWLMGLIAPTLLFTMLPMIWVMNRLGWHVAAQLPFWIGPILVYILLRRWICGSAPTVRIRRTS